MTMPVLLFAAGLGTRMGSLTAHQPKPLVRVAGRALIDHALAQTNTAGVGKRVVYVHYKADMIRDHLAGHDIAISDETDALLETGGGLRHALPLLGAGPVITLNTDAVWRGSNPIATLIDHWRDDMDALLLMVEKHNVHGHLGKGDFRIDSDGRLSRAPDVIYTGVQIIRPDVLHTVAETAFSLNVAWDKIAARGGLFGTTYNGKWCDVGQPDSIPIAEAMLHV